MKKGAGLLIIALFAIMLPQTVNAGMDYSTNSDYSTNFVENAVVLSDNELEEIRGGLTVGGVNISLEFPNFQGGTAINIALPEITITRPDTQVITVSPGGVSIQ